MLRGGETVLTAVSGGADSVALADVLVSLVPELDLKVHLVHVGSDLVAVYPDLEVAVGSLDARVVFSKTKDPEAA